MNATSNHGLFKFLLVLILATSTGSHALNGDDLSPKQAKFFETKIRPILVKHCYQCHSAATGKTKGMLALDTREAIRAGGESGHGVVPGDVEASLIVSAMRHESFEMPPNKELPGSVIRDFEIWIKMGAPDPRDGEAVVKNKSQIDFQEGKSFWAFQKPKKVSPPQVDNAEWAKTDIDRFVMHKLEAAGLKPVERASELQLLRRDYINLLGIPPTESQLQDYLADQSENKRAKLIDKLMESPQFGERWGRHWLDVARFAESNGRERNFLFPHAWRYRDYVIRSFNADKPFDRFVQEQLAGDLLEPTDGQDPLDPKIATGFLAIGPKLLNERNREVFAMDLVDEQMDVVCRSTMALTVTCARCHDHKFDPVSTEDYYALAGIFRSTNTLFGRGGNGSRQATGLISLAEDDDEQAKVEKEHKEKLDQLTNQIKNINNQLKNSTRKKAGKNKRKKGKSQKGKGQEVGQAPTPQATAKLRRRLKTLQQQLKNLRQNGPVSNNVAMGASEGKPVDCNVLIRGEVTAKGAKVSRGFLTVLGETNRNPIQDTDKSGRLELANWITSPENPLTARVTVNRIWRHLFGSGLVRTVDNFGESGERPTHPELLDYLANRLVANQWSFKKTIREIMLSETYQLGNAFSKTNYEVDPDNRNYWRMNSRRMDAEALRDSLMLAAGTLDLNPPKSSIVSQYKSSQGIGRGVTEATFNVSLPHRSVYLPVVRNAVPEPLRVFDFAEPSILVGDRQITTVPTQALYMMNSEFVLEQSKKMAKRLSSPGSTMEEKVQSVYQSILSRLPDEQELERSIGFLNSARDKLLNQNRSESESKELALAAFCQALFATGEFRLLN